MRYDVWLKAEVEKIRRKKKKTREGKVNDLKENCLDKAEVKEELEKHDDCRHEYCNLAVDETRKCWKEILKRFGLDKWREK